PRSPHKVVTVSIGAATLRADSSGQPEDIIAAADRALYRAKQNGRNRVAVDGMVRAIDLSRSRKPTGSDRWPSPVWIDPVFADRLPAVIDHMRRSVSTLAEALDTRDVVRAVGILADLRSSATQYGLEAVDRMAAALDDARAREDSPAVSSLLSELAWYLERVPVVYRQTTD